MHRSAAGRGGLALLGALGAWLATTSPACSLVVDSDGDQCESTTDCTARGAAFAGTSCVEGVCVGGDVEGCATNQECIDALGAFHVCRKDTRACVSLVSTQCTTVEGDYANDEAFLFGSVLPTAGTDAATGKPIENAIKLAIGDFMSTANGLPPRQGSTVRRPLVLIGCNDNSDADTAVVAAQHLAGDVGVPAIIGAAFSGITIKMATEAAIPSGTLVISPSATSVAITDLDDGGLVWRTSPSDIFQADALAQYLPEVEAKVRADLALAPTDSIRVAILHKGDAYGSGLGKAFEKKLVFNGKEALDPANANHYLRIDYGNPDDPDANPPTYGSAVVQAQELQPNIVLIFGTNEGISDIFEPLEQWADDTFPDEVNKPRYLLSDGGLINGLWEAVGSDDDLRRRIRGSVPGPANDLFKTFRSDYGSRFTDGTSPDIFGAAGGYDATYLLAYSLVSIGSGQVSGAALAGGLKKMVSGAGVDVGTGQISSTFPILASGNGIDFNGASGPLDFDVATGEAPSDIQIWCLPKDLVGNATSGTSSGRYYEAATATLKGEDELCP
jgi:branched-chain amino acid transport system substrate-binding protein